MGERERRVRRASARAFKINTPKSVAVYLMPDTHTYIQKDARAVRVLCECMQRGHINHEVDLKCKFTRTRWRATLCDTHFPALCVRFTATTAHTHTHRTDTHALL